MTNHVQELSKASCPAKNTENPYHNEASCICRGIGVLMPELRQYCGYVKDRLFLSPKEVVVCHCGCGGSERGWKLIPVEEQRPIMENWAVSQGYKIKYYGVNVVVELHSRRYSGTYKKFRLPDNEALAHAICKAIGIR